MKSTGITYLLLVLIVIVAGCADRDTTAPLVVNTFPSNGSRDINPSISEIAVTFNEAMMDGNWSWAYTNINEFPEMKGDPYFTEDFTKNILPVKLEPNREYIIWINSEKFQNFKDRSGNPLAPYKFTFKTK